MKVYEIISYESPLNESFGSALFGKAANVLANMVRSGKAKQDIIEYLSSHLVSNNIAKLDVSDPMIKGLISTYGKDVISKAEKLAKETKYANDKAAIAGKLSDIKSGIGSAASTAGSMVVGTGKLIKFLSSLGWGYEMYKPVSDYLSEMENADNQLAMGNIKKDVYDAYQEQRLNIMITRIGANLTASAVSGSLSLGILKRIPFLGGIFGKGSALTGVGQFSQNAIQTYVLSKMNDPTYANAIATIVVDYAMPFEGKLKGLVNSAEETVNDVMADAPSESTPDIKPSQQSNQPAQTTTTATPTTPVDQSTSYDDQYDPHGLWK